MAWSLLSGGHALALLYPLVAGLLAIVVAIAPRVPALARTTVLAVLGLAGVAACLGGHGRMALTPETVLTVSSLGVLVAGVALALRILAPTSRSARGALAVGCALALGGLLLPAHALGRQFPGEFTAYARLLHFRVHDAIPLQAILGALDRRAAPVLFLGLWAGLPMLVLPLAIGFAWPQPGGPWDKAAPLLRPLGYLIVLHLPLAYALYAFNMTGWTDVGAEAAFLPRARLALLALPLALLAQAGALGCVEILRRRRGSTITPAR